MEEIKKAEELVEQRENELNKSKLELLAKLKDMNLFLINKKRDELEQLNQEIKKRMKSWILFEIRCLNSRKSFFISN